MSELPVNTIEFSSDTAHRKRWFKGASFAHPAKMHLSLQMYLIEHYTKKGDTILDPMAGSGTILVACALERNVICVELEGKFVKMQQANWEKIKSLGPMLGYKMGETVILQGDARNLDNVLADAAITSPPYAETDVSQTHMTSNKRGDPNNPNYRPRRPYSDKADCAIFSPPYAENIDKRKDQVQFKKTDKGWRGRAAKKYGYKEIGSGENPNNIANLSCGSISAVISSPPYSDSPVGGGLNIKPPRKGHNDQTGRSPKSSSQMGAGKYDKPDCAIFSPPYEESLGKKHHSPRADKLAKEKRSPHTYTDLDPSIKRLREHGRTDDKAGGPYGISLGHPYSGDNENIGNLNSESYLQAMLVVYQNCHHVLKKNGLMVLVVKNFIRDKKIVQLDLDTIKLCKQAGFALIERLKRKLTQMSFWRRIYMQKFPNAPRIDFEDVLVFKNQ